jgi:hypothetical protein
LTTRGEGCGSSEGRIDLGSMTEYKIKIQWEGPFGLNEVIQKMIDGGEDPDWDGEDYGLYQIYGRHILHGKDTLLYIGITTEQTFSRRFIEHKTWLVEDQDEGDVRIYLGRIYDPQKHTKKDKWKSWEKDVKLAEKILIYKYSPNYNSEGLTSEPNLYPHNSVRLVHVGERNKLEKEDIAPNDFRE